MNHNFFHLLKSRCSFKCWHWKRHMLPWFTYTIHWCKLRNLQNHWKILPLIVRPICLGWGDHTFQSLYQKKDSCEIVYKIMKNQVFVFPVIISYSSISSIKRDQTTMSTTVLEELHKIVEILHISDNGLF